MSKSSYAKLGEITAEQFYESNKGLGKSVFAALKVMAAASQSNDKFAEDNLGLFKERERVITTLPFLWVHPEESLLDYPAGLYEYKSLPHSYAPIQRGRELTHFMIYQTVWQKVRQLIGEGGVETVELIKAYTEVEWALRSFERDKHLLELTGLPTDLPDMDTFLREKS